MVIKNVRTALQDRHMTSIELSRVLSPERTPRAAEVHLSRRMAGVTPFSVDDLQRLSGIFGMPPCDLLMDGHPVDPVMTSIGNAINLLRLEFSGGPDGKSDGKSDGQTHRRRHSLRLDSDG